MKLQNKDSIMNLGDTSFRRKNLLDDYKVMLQGITEQLEEWNINNNSQINFYQYVAKSGLIDEIFFLDYYAFISGKFKENNFSILSCSIFPFNKFSPISVIFLFSSNNPILNKAFVYVLPLFFCSSTK